MKTDKSLNSLKKNLINEIFTYLHTLYVVKKNICWLSINYEFAVKFGIIYFFSVLVDK